MVTVRTNETLIRRNVDLFRTHRGWSPHTEGVAMMLGQEAQHALIGWEPMNSRIIRASFVTKKEKNQTKHHPVLCSYKRRRRREDMMNSMNSCKMYWTMRGAKDITILMGGFNAKIGKNNTGYKDIMGTHGLGEMNENGERFVNLCALNHLVIGGSVFPHKRIHKATWRSPDHITENQIDHICINKKFRRSWQDMCE